MATQTVQAYYPSLSNKQFLLLCPCAGKEHRAIFANNLLSPSGASFLTLTLVSGPESHPLGGIVVTFEYNDADLPTVDGEPISVVFPTPGCGSYTVGWPVCVDELLAVNGVHTFRVSLVAPTDEVADGSHYGYRNQARSHVDFFYFDTFEFNNEGVLHITLKAFGFSVFTSMMTGDSIQVNRSQFAAGFETGIFAKDTPFTIETEWVPDYAAAPEPLGLAISPVQRIL